MAITEADTELPATQAWWRDLTEVPGWDQCRSALLAGRSAWFDRVFGSSRAMLVAALTETLPSPLVVIVKDDQEADRLIDDLPLFSLREPAEFRATQSTPDSDELTDEQYGQRLWLLRQLANSAPQSAADSSRKTANSGRKSHSSSGSPLLIVATLTGMQQPVVAADALRKQQLVQAVGQPADVEQLRAWLTENHYVATSAVALPSEFAIRGGIVDVYSPDAASPVRIELAEDRIESIRIFDPATQRSLSSVTQIDLAGASSGGDQTHTLLDYVPPDSVVLLVEPVELSAYDQQHAKLRGKAEQRISFSDLQRQWGRFPIAVAQRLGMSPPGETVDGLGAYCPLPIELLGSFAGDLGNVRMELQRMATNSHVTLVANADGEIQRLKEILDDLEPATRGKFSFTLGCLHEGFRLQHSARVIVGCDEIFHRRDLRRTTRRRLGKPIDSFLELREGQLVVHLSHGIGRFRGLRLLDHHGTKSEHLELEFSEGARILVPVDKIDLVQKYVGGTKRSPALAKIGSATWLRQKQAAQQAVTDLASDMLSIQASRMTRPGLPMAEDSQWQYEFEQTFPYTETDDQLVALQAIKQDMQAPRPMDRLLCGDVGFGKTELAMRAAFKAVDNGYQVAVLVPTTVLAEQHFRSFRERMAQFPVTIGRLSRFAPAEEQRRTLEGIKTGHVDLVIGTHRLASRAVRPKNLGLVIIDEEQRFGVGIKERLKSLRSEVHVLTLSATPIPRTLHMSLVGVRDISNLETAPAERLAVDSKVARFNYDLIREAIVREMNRSGQVYFVHNRVNDIHQIYQMLQSVVPQARIAVGHGQMDEEQLEDVMNEFIDGKHDILLATTIIENGLDIPNANTMIVNDADRYGLADLHQLRGRVGRYKHKAYCYFLVDPRKPLTPAAARRLHAIEQFSHMGAGFAIAMRDLEIRGAGNLLGTEQSGHIAAVGYELYCQLLENAVRSLKHLPARLSRDIDIDLPVEAYLPDDFVPDRRQKLDIYRRLTRAESYEQIRQMAQEIRDRYGPLPRSVRRLLQLAEIKLDAAVWQMKSVFVENRYLGMRFADRSRMKQLVEQSKIKLRAVDDSTCYVPLKSADISGDQLLTLTKSILRGT